jgi:hypothetical protein
MKMRATTREIARLFRFDCGGRFGASKSMVRLQEEGVAALCRILDERPVAFLADEVGLGKTMQALGVIGWRRNVDANARILVITPRENVQDGWMKDASRFGEFIDTQRVVGRLHRHERLSELLREVKQEGVVHLLRHPSFTRPFNVDDKLGWQGSLDRLKLPEIDDFPPMPPACSPDTRSRIYNLAFAKAVNAWFKREEIYFDLVVVDEAQCLRNPTNQTNAVLRTLLKGVAKRWLFVSATPAHSGVSNIATLFNTYPGDTDADAPHGILIAQRCPKSAHDLLELKRELSKYMIRRPRTFVVNNQPLGKGAYRRDDTVSLASKCESSLDTLSIALVQKHLVDVLDNQGNRFKTGYLASFESLEDSLRSKIGTSAARNNRASEPQESEADGSDEDDVRDDFLADPNAGAHDSTAPDAQYVSTLSRGFEEKFGFSLPHPKLDAVSSDLAWRALGRRDAGEPGGSKTLVFCRRVSSVKSLRKRLMRSYFESIEKRCSGYWQQRLDWKTGVIPAGGRPADALRADEAIHDDDNAREAQVDASEDSDEINPLRVALRSGGWLYRFRRQFEDGYRHALVFEHNWFLRLCAEGGVSPERACGAVPDDLWMESYSFAMDNGRQRRLRQTRYLVWNCLARHAQLVFGMDETQGAFWRSVLEAVYPPSVRYAAPASDTVRDDQPDRELLLYRSLWTRIEDSAWAETLTLPGREPGLPDDETERRAFRENVLWRQVLVRVLSQYMRLTDTLLDLLCADRGAAQTDDEDMLDHFVRWLVSEDIDAVRLRGVWQQWAQQYVLIFSSAIGEAHGETLDARAGQTDFDFLNVLDPVVGVVGGSGGQKRAIQQFNTPGMPWVMVGTDAIREGVNLHLFCDRVMHYGLAWTPGDLEQRVGRVDRYFSLIERRLKTASASMPTLDMLYPHLVDTVERRQIDIVMQKKKLSDAVTDDGFSNVDGRGATTISLSAPLPVEHPAQSKPERFFGVGRHLRR